MQCVDYIMPLEHCIRKAFIKSTRWLPDDVHPSVNLRKIQSDKITKENYHVLIICTLNGIVTIILNLLKCRLLENSELYGTILKHVFA